MKQDSILKGLGRSYSPPEGEGGSVVRELERVASRHAWDVAVSDGAGVLTYGELNAEANGLAGELLRSHPGGSQDPVAFVLGHDRWAVVAMLGILKAGRPYVALHGGNPAERLQGMLRDSGSRCLISRREFAPVIEGVAGAVPGLRVLYLEDVGLTSAAEAPGIYVPGEAPFCITYTSGSTGDPKGLVVTHENVVFDTYSDLRDWGVTEGDRTSLVFFIGFGAAYPCVMTAFLRGGRLCLFDFAREGPEAALKWVQSERITILRLTPSIWRAMFARAPEGTILSSVRIVSLGGEAARVSDFVLFKQHTLPSSRFQNQLASSEAGDVAELTLGHGSELSGESLPAGLPLPGHEVTIVDGDDRPVGVGETGEIVIRSRHLHAGYWRQPELTAERYVSDPVDAGIKVLHTGDLGRWLASGMLEYVGRKDSMVKVRGYRVVLSEIEFHIQSSGLVDQVAVVARSLPNLPGHTQLFGYVSPRTGEVVDLAALRAYLLTKLPEYSMPTVFVTLDRLPINPHGKVDRQALPEPAQRTELLPEDLPRDELEVRLLQIWASLLRNDRLGVHDNFFELGGDSLSVLSMMLEVEQVLGKAVPRSFLAQPTIRKLADSLRGHEQTPETIDPAFRLQPRPPTPGRHRYPAYRVLVKLRRYPRTLPRIADEANVMLWVLARRTRSLTLGQAKALVYRWADQPWLLNTVYYRKQRLFRHYLASLGVPTPHFAALFRKNFVANLLFKVVEGGRPWRERDGSVFERDRRAWLEQSSLDQLDEVFPVTGMAHLEAAYRGGRGVILLAFHGSADGKVSTHVLSRRLGGVPIQSIARLMAEKQSEFRSRTLMPKDVRGSLYAELAWHGQALLRQGHILRVLADNSGPEGWLLLDWTVGDRMYRMRPGFAELALNTGASIVPVYARFIEDGRLSIHVMPPLQLEPGTRQEQVAALVRAYASFINHAVKTHPEMVLWKKMRNHLAAPRVEGA